MTIVPDWFLVRYMYKGHFLRWQNCNMSCMWSVYDIVFCVHPGWEECGSLFISSICWITNNEFSNEIQNPLWNLEIDIDIQKSNLKPEIYVKSSRFWSCICGDMPWHTHEFQWPIAYALDSSGQLVKYAVVQYLFEDGVGILVVTPSHMQKL